MIVFHRIASLLVALLDIGLFLPPRRQARFLLGLAIGILLIWFPQRMWGEIARDPRFFQENSVSPSWMVALGWFFLLIPWILRGLALFS